MRIHWDPLQRFASMFRDETAVNSVSASHGVGGEPRGAAFVEHTLRRGSRLHSPPLLQLVWPLLNTLLALGAVRLTFRETLEVRYRLQMERHPTLFPSPHLQRLGPDIAVFSDVRFCLVQRPHQTRPSLQTSSLVVFQRTPLYRIPAICVRSQSTSP